MTLDVVDIWQNVLRREKKQEEAYIKTKHDCKIIRDYNKQPDESTNKDMMERVDIDKRLKKRRLLKERAKEEEDRRVDSEEGISDGLHDNEEHRRRRLFNDSKTRNK